MKIEETVKFRDSFTEEMKRYPLCEKLLVPDEFTEWIENNSEKFNCMAEKDDFLRSVMIYRLYPYDISFFRRGGYPDTLVCFLGWTVSVQRFMDDEMQKHIVVKVWPVYFEHNSVIPCECSSLNSDWVMNIFEVSDLDDFGNKVTHTINMMNQRVLKSSTPVSEREKALICFENAQTFTDDFIKCLWVKKPEDESVVKDSEKKFKTGDICWVKCIPENFEFGDYTVTKDKFNHTVRIIEPWKEDGYIVFDYDADLFTVFPSEVLELADLEAQEHYRYNKK